MRTVSGGAVVLAGLLWAVAGCSVEPRPATEARPDRAEPSPSDVPPADGLSPQAPVQLPDQAPPQQARSPIGPAEQAPAEQAPAEQAPAEQAPAEQAVEATPPKPPKSDAHATSGPEADPLEALYLGTHGLGVNRIGDSRRLGTVVIKHAPDGGLSLSGGLEGRGDAAGFRIQLVGTVHPKGEREFLLDGQISGVPDMRWADEAPRERVTRGLFTFRAKGKRKYWRMYEVDGHDCVCGEGCGNDFCYIDIDF